MNRDALESMVEAYMAENPEMSREEAVEKARTLRRELWRLNRNWTNSQKRFGRMTVLVGRGIDDPGESWAS